MTTSMGYKCPKNEQTETGLPREVGAKARGHAAAGQCMGPRCLGGGHFRQCSMNANLGLCSAVALLGQLVLSSVLFPWSP